MTITAGVTEVGEVLPNGQRPLPSLGCAFGFATPPLRTGISHSIHISHFWRVIRAN